MLQLLETVLVLVAMAGAGNLVYQLTPKHYSRAGFALTVAGFVGFALCSVLWGF